MERDLEMAKFITGFVFLAAMLASMFTTAQACQLACMCTNDGEGPHGTKCTVIRESSVAVPEADAVLDAIKSQMLISKSRDWPPGCKIIEHSDGNVTGYCEPQKA